MNEELRNKIKAIATATPIAIREMKIERTGAFQITYRITLEDGKIVEKRGSLLDFLNPENGQALPSEVIKEYMTHAKPIDSEKLYKDVRLMISLRGVPKTAYIVEGDV